MSVGGESDEKKKLNAADLLVTYGWVRLGVVMGGGRCGPGAKAGVAGCVGGLLAQLLLLWHRTAVGAPSGGGAVEGRQRRGGGVSPCVWALPCLALVLVVPLVGLLCGDLVALTHV